MKKVQESLLEYRKHKIPIKAFKEKIDNEQVSLISFKYFIFRRLKMSLETMPQRKKKR